MEERGLVRCPVQEKQMEGTCTRRGKTVRRSRGRRLYGRRASGGGTWDDCTIVRREGGAYRTRKGVLQSRRRKLDGAKRVRTWMKTDPKTTAARAFVRKPEHSA